MVMVVTPHRQSALVFSSRDRGHHPFCTDLALMRDRGGVKIFYVGTSPTQNMPSHTIRLQFRLEIKNTASPIWLGVSHSLLPVASAVSMIGSLNRCVCAHMKL